MEKKLQNLQERRCLTLSGGGEEKVEEQKQGTGGSARERINMLLDKDSFVELGTFVQGDLEDAGNSQIETPGEGVVTGYGTVEGRPVYLFAQDSTVAGGALGRMHAQKICRMLDLAGQNGAPLIGLYDSAGVRIQEGIDALGGYGSIFHRSTRYSGVVPQLSVIMGSCIGGATYSPALGDFVFMIDQAGHMFTAGPQVVAAVTGEETTVEELGGAAVHSSASGAAHFFAASEADSLEQVRTLLGFLPSNNVEDPPTGAAREPQLEQEELIKIVPGCSDEPYDMREVIRRVVDGGALFEVHERYARNAVIGFARLAGLAVGVVANQPQTVGGWLDIDASDKISRFIRFCDSFNLPLITFVDVPGFLPGAEQERGGVGRHGAKIIYAYSEATVPKITLVVRKAYGGAYIAMGSRSLGADLCLAWPTAEIAVLAPEGAAEIIQSGELDGANNHEKLLAEAAQSYRDRLANPYIAAARGWIDEVIDPRQTRAYLCRALGIVGLKRVQRPARKHGNIPL